MKCPYCKSDMTVIGSMGRKTFWVCTKQRMVSEFDAMMALGLYEDPKPEECKRMVGGFRTCGATITS